MPFKDFNILTLKELTYEKLFSFDYQILISNDNPLKDQEISIKDLKKQIELKHGDIHIQDGKQEHHKHFELYQSNLFLDNLNSILFSYYYPSSNIQ